jgi:hypothetical protein
MSRGFAVRLCRQSGDRSINGHADHYYVEILLRLLSRLGIAMKDCGPDDQQWKTESRNSRDKSRNRRFIKEPGDHAPA